MRNDDIRLDATRRARYDIARLRWRADLLEHSATQLRTIEHIADAELKESLATTNRKMADAIEDFEDTIAEHGRDSDEAQAARLRLAKARHDLRSEGVTAETVSNFQEPAPEELGV